MAFLIREFTDDEKQLFAEEEYGLEKESLRVDSSGRIALTPHPFHGDPKRDRDFAESQVEMITGVHSTLEGLMEELRELQGDTIEILRNQPGGGEILWPFSNPAVLDNADAVPIARYEGELKQKEEYREYLAEKYGKKKMLFSGIHFNFSFRQEVLQKDYEKKKLKGLQEDFGKYKDAMYLDLAGKLLEKCWLIVYLTAASPVFDGSYFSRPDQGKTVVSAYASPRCGREGYWNDFLPVLDFTSASGYAGSIEKYVDGGQLMQPSELYYPLRLKPRGAYSMEKLKKGINHIELRMLDLNPYEYCGIDERDLKFISLLLHCLAFLPEKEISKRQQETAIADMKAAAELEEASILIHDGEEEAKTVSEAALSVLAQMEEELAGFEAVWPDLKEILQYEKDKVLHPEQRYARQIIRDFGNGYVKKELSLQRTMP